jgi:putative hemolysin
MDLITSKDLLSANKNLRYLGGEYFARLLMKILKLSELNDRYKPLAHLKGLEFVDTVIKEIGFEYEISEEDIERIPKETSFITISNHPYGGVDGLLLMKIMGTARPDFKILVNFLLTKLEPVEDFFLPVNPFETHKDVRSSFSGLKEAFNHLHNGFPLGIYPSGEVSSYKFDKRMVTDRKWQYSVIKFIKKAQVPVVPIYFDGHNSTLFQLLGFIHPVLRTVKLPSELLNKQGKMVRVRIGNPIPVKDQEQFSDINDYGKYLRTKTYGLGISFRQKKAKPYVLKEVEDVIDPVSSLDIEKEVEQIQDEHLLFRLQEYSIICVPTRKIPNIIREIGRLREITYREVGEGTNKSMDIDEFDHYFEQIFIWDNEAKKIAGGYRVGKGRNILKEYGIKGFYIQTLFRIGQQMIPILNETIELGRSFIVKEYQKKMFSLFLLWKGILYVLLKHPEYRYLIGPVSISSTFSDLSKALTVEFIKANYFNYELAEYIKPRKEFRYKIDKTINMEAFLRDTENDTGKLDRFIQDIEPSFKTPVLLKKYFNLNAEILGFNIDPKFNNCLDGLMILDLLDVPMNTIEGLSKEINDSSILERFKK